jgi:hypothetical protein
LAAVGVDAGGVEDGHAQDVFAPGHVELVTTALEGGEDVGGDPVALDRWALSASESPNDR